MVIYEKKNSISNSPPSVAYGFGLCWYDEHKTLHNAIFSIYVTRLETYCCPAQNAMSKFHLATIATSTDRRISRYLTRYYVPF